MGRAILLAVLLSALAGCSPIQNTFGGLFGGGAGAAKRASLEVGATRFRARATPDAEDKRNFAVSVSPLAVNPEGALEAARYQATRYCLLTYGGSDTEWVAGPDTPLSQLPIDGDQVTLRGRCTHR